MSSLLPDIQFKALADALLARAETLVPLWLPGGRRAGAEWVCGSLSGGHGRSCSVNLRTGLWSDFAGGDGDRAAGGDLISLYAAIHGLDQGQAAVRVARDEGLEDVAGVQRSATHQRPPRPPVPPPAAVRPTAADEGWATVRPVPANAPPPTFRHHHRPVSEIVNKAEYRVGGELHGYIVRFRKSDGGKDDLPYTWCTSARDGAARWHWRQFDEPRPLYLPGGAMPGTRTVIVCEGEPKTAALQALLDAAMPGVYCAATWPGGCKAWAKADWSWLQGCTVLLWPDCDSKRAPLSAVGRKAALAGVDASDAAAVTAALDAAKAAQPYLPADKQPGWAAMLGLGVHLRDTQGCQVRILPLPEPGTLKDGWDCGDAIAEGWDAPRVVAYFGQAQPLPPTPAQPAAAPPSAPPPPPAGDRPAGAGSGGLPQWLAPFFDGDKGKWQVSRKLVIAALRHDDALRGLVGLNELSNAIDALRQPPWPQGSAGPIKGSFDLALGGYLSDTYGLPSISRQALGEAVEFVASEQPFHPVRDWLHSLAWDRVTRIDKWLIHALGLTPAQLSPALREYLTLVGRFWLLGMVNRVMRPGCKFDYCVVLEGKGGLGKSTLAKVLTGEQWFSSTHIELGRGKEAEEQVQGIWCWEIAELSSVNKADITLIKSFISNQVDRYRPAYGRVLESYPRQCVLVGTTNDRQYLRDRTGNRRFWPVPVKARINNPWVERMREQLFAEAMELYREGAPYAPSPDDEDRLFEPMQDARVMETSITSELMHVLTRPAQQGGIGAVVHGQAQHLTLSQLVQALGVDPGKSAIGVEQQIKAWLDREGWDYRRLRVGEGGARIWVYVRPIGWPPEEDAFDMEAPPEPPPGHGGGAAGGAPHGNHSRERDDAPF